MKIDLTKQYIIPEVMRLLSVGYGTARKLIESGALQGERVNGMWRVSGAVLAEYIRTL